MVLSGTVYRLELAHVDEDRPIASDEEEGSEEKTFHKSTTNLLLLVVRVCIHKNELAKTTGGKVVVSYSSIPAGTYLVQEDWTVLC